MKEYKSREINVYPVSLITHFWISIIKKKKLNLTDLNISQTIQITHKFVRIQQSWENNVTLASLITHFWIRTKTKSDWLKHLPNSSDYSQICENGHIMKTSYQKCFNRFPFTKENVQMCFNKETNRYSYMMIKEQCLKEIKLTSVALSYISLNKSSWMLLTVSGSANISLSWWLASPFSADTAKPNIGMLSKDTK